MTVASQPKSDEDRFDCILECKQCTWRQHLSQEWGPTGTRAKDGPSPQVFESMAFDHSLETGHAVTIDRSYSRRRIRMVLSSELKGTTYGM